MSGQESAPATPASPPEDEDTTSLAPTEGVEASTLERMKNKTCQVCGDKALGYNFNAVTCESCKAFFRRNAIKNKEFKCPFSDKCEVTVVTRRFCQKCRLKKCFDVGMKKEYILSDEEKKQKRQKIEENKRTKGSEVGGASVEAAYQLPNSAENSPSIHSTTEPILLTTERGEHIILERPTAVPSPVALLDRPQARVLPSTRQSDEGPPRAKVMRLAQGEVITTTTVDPIQHTTSLPPAHQPHPQPQVTLLSRELGHVTYDSSSQQQQPINLGIKTETNVAATAIAHPVVAHVQQQQHPDYARLPYVIDAAASSASAAFAVASDWPPNTNAISHPAQPPQPAPTPIAIPSTSQQHHHQQQQQQQQQQQTPRFVPDFSQTTPDNLDELIDIAIAAEFHAEAVDSANHVHLSRFGKDLHQRESDSLFELYVASRALVEPLELDQTAADINGPDSLISVINLTGLAVKRVIRMAKKIGPFNKMCKEDQESLLKGGCTEIMVIRSVMNYNAAKNAWNLPSKANYPRELSMEVLKEASQLGVNLYEEHQKFVTSFDPKWRTDENVMLLLSAITLFSPKRPNLAHRDTVKLEQDSYFFLLRRYLETQCENGCEAKRIYLHLIHKLKELQRLNESHIQLLLEVNPKLVEPLLKEVFDLAPRRSVVGGQEH